MGTPKPLTSKPGKRFWGTTWKKFIGAIDDFNLIVPGDRVLAMVSGGPDSTAMAYWLGLFAQRVPFSFAIAHFDHGLRKDSRVDVKLVQALAKRLNAKVYCRKLPVRRFADSKSKSLEDAGRILRYRFAEEIAKKGNFNKVVTAHTMDEQAESVLLNMLRGGSREGLGGARMIRKIRPGSKVLLIRPMLRVTKREILDYLETAKISYVQDPTNRDPRFLRNRIRLEVIPKLCELNPKAIEHLAKLAGMS